MKSPRRKSMISRLLRKNISVGQILGYALASLVGLAIVVSATRAYTDFAAALSSSDESENPLISSDYLVLSKQVSLLNTLGSPTAFSQADIADLKSQPWVEDVGEFEAANFNVAASVALGGRGMSTYMFLESIPDRFVDVMPTGWDVLPDDSIAEVPIILSKDYLALYNFGFAATRGLPQLTEGMISQVPVMLTLSGNGKTHTYRARIAGFSSRLNTIAVPQGFLERANVLYAPGVASQPSRLIVKVNDPGAPQIEDYLDTHGYEVAGDKATDGRAGYFLRLVSGIVISVGAVITLLALFILMLSVNLLLQKNRTTLRSLMLLGYSPMQVAAGYYRLIGAVNLAVLLLAVCVMLVASECWQRSLAALDIAPSSPWLSILVGVAIMLIVTAINFLSISLTLRRIFHGK